MGKMPMSRGKGVPPVLARPPVWPKFPEGESYYLPVPGLCGKH